MATMSIVSGVRTALEGVGILDDIVQDAIERWLETKPTSPATRLPMRKEDSIPFVMNNTAN